MKIEHKVYQNKVNSFVVKNIPADAKKILDIGCGSGVHASYLKERDPSRHIDGVTLSPNEAELARGVCRRVWIHNLENGLPPEINGVYDCILCSHVLEHICWPEKLLLGIRSALSKKGTLVVAIPNLFYIKKRIQLALGNFDYEETGLWDESHFRWYTLASGQAMLEKNGFELIDRFVDGYLPQGVLRTRFGGLSALLDKFAVRQRPQLFGWQFIYVAQRKGGH